MAEDYVEALRLMASGHTYGIEKQARERVQRHLERTLLQHIFGDTPQMHSEQMALATLKTLAAELDAAAEALSLAAGRLKLAGQGRFATEAYLAHKAAKQSAGAYRG